MLDWATIYIEALLGCVKAAAVVTLKVKLGVGVLVVSQSIFAF